MTTSRVPAVLDALVSTLAAGLPDVTVYDGPYLQRPDGDFVCVGWTPSGDVSANATQDFASLGAGRRTEIIEVACYADSFSGDVEIGPRRAAAYALVGEAEDALRADPTLGGAVTQPGWAHLTSHELYQEQTASGVAVGVTFRITVQVRI